MTVHVFGSVNMDHVAYVATLPQPGETIHGRYQSSPGGKGGNQAVASARNGEKTIFYGAIGSDGAGEELVAFLKSEGVELRVERVDAPTGVALITVDNASENVIAMCPGANSEARFRDTAIEPGDVAVIQGETPVSEAERFISYARAVGATTLVNPAPYFPISKELRTATSLLVLNEIELSQWLGQSFQTIETLTDNIPEGVVVTLGPRGALINSDGNVQLIPSRPATAVDTTGAGDCFVGNLAAELSRGADAVDAVAFSVAAAGLSVEKEGAAQSMPKRAEVLAALAR